MTATEVAAASAPTSVLAVCSHAADVAIDACVCLQVMFLRELIANYTARHSISLNAGGSTSLKPKPGRWYIFHDRIVSL